MTGCAVRALLSVLALVACIAAVGIWLGQAFHVAPADAVGIALLAGFLAWVAAALLIAAVKAWRERVALRTALDGTPPAEGRAVLVGRLEPAGPTLTAPLSGRECLAYTYEVYEMRGSGKRARKVVHCDGLALAPSVVTTRAGTFRLLAVPELDCDDADLDRQAALTRAAMLMRTTPFTPPAAPFTRPEIEQQWNDQDGAYRRDRRHVDGEVDLANCRMVERHLEPGAKVSVFGRYSAAQRAMVADPADWSKITRVMKGDPDTSVGQLRASMVRRTVGALLFAGAAAGALAAFLANRP